jgi:CheY-like chemotaxis protein
MAHRKVLVAANSPLFSRSLARMIAQGEYEVMQSGDAAEVVSLVTQGEVDFCFMQDMLAGASGLECCAELARHPLAREVPVILFSRKPEVGNEALEKGASDFLRVPCLAEDVLDLLGRWSKIAQQPQPAAVPSPAPENETVSGPQVLLVDDSKLIHTYMEKVFSETSYRLLQAYDGIAGLDMACQYVPDLIISDIDMPNMNGFDMCKKVKETAETEHIPILILSARGSGVDIERGFDVSANDYLTKPVEENELLSRVEMALVKEGEDKREKILVVEDSRLHRNLVVQSLEQQGFEIAAAEDGQIGLNKAIEWLPDLVITDSEMPVMNGRDLTREIKKRDEL